MSLTSDRISLVAYFGINFLELYNQLKINCSILHLCGELRATSPGEVDGTFCSSLGDHLWCYTSGVLTNQLIVGQKSKGQCHRITKCKIILKVIKWPVYAPSAQPSSFF